MTIESPMQDLESSQQKPGCIPGFARRETGVCPRIPIGTGMPTEAEWADRAKRFLKAELKRADVTYEDLVRRLEAHGFKETKASIASKLSRGAFPATFFLAALAAIECETVTLADL
jgi:hypothetical protein